MKTSRVQSLAAAAITVMAATSATPTISAPPVRAVRFGFLIALSRARTPVMPVILASGVPSAAATGRAIAGPRANTPTKLSSAPTPTHRISEPASPATNAPMPAAVSTPPCSRRRPRRSAETPAPASRMAANGGTRAARSDGNTAEAMVTTVPTSSATTAVRAVNTVPPAGMSMPKPSIIALRPPATATPAISPTTDAVIPMITASSSWDQTTCLRIAPTARSRAISRLRWVTVIWNVL